MSPSSRSGADDVKTYLSQVREATLTELRVKDNQPVLIFRTERVIAAFAFADSDPVSTYRQTYEAFKNESERLEEWDRYDLSFVLCVSQETEKIDQLASDIETDVFFCRKFVVPLLDPVGNALARLPFLPLSPLDGPALRPSSAQTFLQQCGVPTALSRQIVVQYERGAERIIESCLAEEYGKPEKLTRVRTLSEVQSEPGNPAVKLESITIENFRAYRLRQTFEIGSEITVLFGPNGFGKTSFFDAVDFAVTGSIGRLKFTNPDHFRQVAAHLDSNGEKARVALTYRSNGEVHQIDRSVEDANHALFDGIERDRKSILKLLTSSGDAVAERIDNLINLFRASHLFSQDNQALTRDFNYHCSLPREIVSRMLAFEDYENAVKKSSAVAALLEKGIQDLSSELTETAASLKEDKSELEDLRRKTKDNANIGALTAELRNLRKALKEIGIDAGSGATDAAVARGWRATLEARVADSEGTMAVISEIAKDVANLPSLTREGAELKVRLDAGNSRKAQAEELRTGAQSQLNTSRQSTAEIASQLAQAQTDLDNLKWARAQRKPYADLLKAVEDQKNLVKQATTAIATNQALSATASADLEQKSAVQGAAMADQAAKHKRVSALEVLQAAIGPWKASRDRLSEIKAQEQILNNKIIELRTAVPALQAQISSSTSQQASLTRIIADADQTKTEMQQLLSQLQKHIKDSDCPLCGVNHGSRDELIRSIQAQMELDSAGSARTELAAARLSSEGISRQLAANQEAQRSSGAQLLQLSEERVVRETEIAGWVKSVAGLGLDASANVEELSRQIAGHLATLRKDIQATSLSVRTATQAVEAARTVVSDLAQAVSLQVTQRTTLSAELDRVQTELTALRGDPRLNGVRIDASDEDLQKLEVARTDRIAKLRESHQAKTGELAKTQEQIAAASKVIAELGGELPIIRVRMNEIEQARTSIFARLSDAKLPQDADEAELVRRLGTETQAQARLRALHQSVASVEVGLDAVTTAAALARLQEKVAGNEQAIAEKKAARAARKPWREYFSAVEKLLSNEQAEAITNFTRQYGPRTSVIQRRLRSVYGFDDVEIDSRQSEITVKVKRHGVELRPVDYFSESQKQTLQLGLFLTACSGQNWSSLSPVFLDDPITHFDDLNTYALLDLIVGLLKSEFGNRQFIISTCDEKFFQLARQKFNYLKDSVRFYRFRAIGEDGPVVEAVIH